MHTQHAQYAKASLLIFKNNTVTKSTLEGNRLVLLVVYSPSSMEVRSGAPRILARGTSQSRDLRRRLLTVLLSVPCSAWSLLQPITTCPGWSCSQWAGLPTAVNHQENALQTCPLNWGPFFSNDLSFVTLTKLTSTSGFYFVLICDGIQP